MDNTCIECGIVELVTTLLLSPNSHDGPSRSTPNIWKVNWRSMVLFHCSTISNIFISIGSSLNLALALRKPVKKYLFYQVQDFNSIFSSSEIMHQVGINTSRSIDSLALSMKSVALCFFNRIPIESVHPFMECRLIAKDRLLPSIPVQKWISNNTFGAGGS